MTATKTEPRYGTLLDDLRQMRDEAKADMRAARDQDMRMSAQGRVHEFERAIRIVEAAEKIPAKRTDEGWVADEKVQFGFRSRNGSVGVPPNLLDVEFFPRIRYMNHIFVAWDPIHIATLDAAAAVGGCQRVPYGAAYALPPDGGVEGVWVGWEQYQSLKSRGMAR